MPGSDIKIEGLNKHFYKGENTIEVLKDLDLSLASGARAAIIGQSGSGKSTFLHVLGTLDRPTAGRIWLGGVDVISLNGAELDRLRNREIGFVFQFHHLLSDHDALQNVMMPAIIAGETFASASADAKKLLDRVGLSHRLHHRPGILSGGEQQRVAIARALVRHPSMILADEPTGNLDPSTASEVMEVMREINEEQGSTLIVVTHDTELANQFPQVMKLTNGSFEENN
jgi:lipoprotein-releasing system ATP-binding protein